ncbi:arylsulfatase, putative [Talaromyces stipitatus ATCC 10500]|uniref:Arylsulfatase n=1 Tax=Talaromyces stipitatus (strain ATCC 10500 / CBS 375.48 / QM 6759 / NRRL 1006) TaxID=441959 RepID=B8MIE7_TALSN|nr:arylsulfatase, putative [Talaromyces stipitatus ATCC 10500]EED14631.1 arylsulfatase, putative [Talaromyces stipitatus ATCC 10500]
MRYRAVLSALSCVVPVLANSAWQQVLGEIWSEQQQVAPARAPNFVFIITDDQDLELDSLHYMPLVSRHLKAKGTFFRNHFVTTALCCPSRVSLWTGRQAHNTNVTDVSPPYGGYPKFVERGFNDDFLPVWLQTSGYNTFYTGKLFNFHTVDNYDSPYVNGFTGSDFLLDPFTYSYLNATFQRNREPPVSYKGHHTTEVITDKALGFLEDGLAEDQPFFLVIAPIAPHSNIDVGALDDHGAPTVMTEPIPLSRHENLFQDAKVPRTAHFNPDEPNGVSWVRNLPKQDDQTIEYNDHFYRQRLRALQGVDELVGAVVNRLEDSDQLDNTYIIYTSDNGYHIGQHRLPPGKACGFEEDIRVPFLIRGPGIAKGADQDAVTTHIDIAPTLLKLAGIPLRDDLDGTPMPLHPNSNETRHEHVAVEYWGRGYLEGLKGAIDNSPVVPNNTYKSVRLIGDGFDLYYSVWCNNEHELYDLTTDRYQLNNLYYNVDSSNRQIQGFNLRKIIDRLDSLLLVLKSCKGDTCINPWNTLHSDGAVSSFKDALHEMYDAFYQHQPSVSFSRCELGQILDAEGPQEPLVYRHGLSWEVWT